MRRTVCYVGLVALVSVVAWAWSGDRPRAAPKADEKPVPRWEELIAVLWSAHPWGGFEQNKDITLTAALSELAKNSKWRGVSFDIDERAFKADGISPQFPFVAEKAIEPGTMTL